MLVVFLPKPKSRYTHAKRAASTKFIMSRPTTTSVLCVHRVSVPRVLIVVECARAGGWPATMRYKRDERARGSTFLRRRHKSVRYTHRIWVFVILEPSHMVSSNMMTLSVEWLEPLARRWTENSSEKKKCWLQHNPRESSVNFFSLSRWAFRMCMQIPSSSVLISLDDENGFFFLFLRSLATQKGD